MKKLLLFAFFLATFLPISAQETMTLRDSLSVLIREIDQHPQQIDLRFRKAQINMLLQQWQYAQEEYTNILRLSPHNAEALYFRAYAYGRQGYYDFAAADYEKVCQLVPGNLNAMIGLALSRDKQGRKTEAMSMLNHMVELFPDSAVVYITRGNMEMERQQIEIAEYDFARAVALAPQQTDYLLLHAESLIRLNRKQEALSELNRMLTLGVPRSALDEYYRRCREK